MHPNGPDSEAQIAPEDDKIHEHYEPAEKVAEKSRKLPLVMASKQPMANRKAIHPFKLGRQMWVINKSSDKGYAT